MEKPYHAPEYYMTDAMKVDAKFCYTQTLAGRLQADKLWHRHIHGW